MDLESAIQSTETLFSAASEEVLIFDGHFDPKIYGNERIVKQIKDAVDRGVNIKVICDDTVQVTNPVILDLITQGRISIHKISFKKEPLKGIRRLIGFYPGTHIDSRHYVVVDESHTRLEEPHTVDSDVRRALIVYFDEKAEKYARNFRERLQIN